MEGSSSAASGPPDSEATQLSGPWSVWWIRVLLFIAHLTLLVAAASLTPAGYFFQLGEITGSVMVVGALFLWLLLVCEATRDRFVVLRFGLGSNWFHCICRDAVPHGGQASSRTSG